MSKSGTPTPNRPPVQAGKQDAEARAWLLTFASGEASPEKERAFADWLAASEENRLAYERAHRLWEGLAEVDGIEDLLTERDNVRKLPQRPALTRRLLLGGGLAAGLACAAAVGLVALQPAPVEEIMLVTARGEIKTFTLSDGSQITLGGASRVRGEFSGKTRDLQLAAGNAYFDIARDENRPLTVDTGDVQVRVLGTRFDIKKRADRVSVSVDSGHVRVTAGNLTETRDLLAGDKIVSTAAMRLGAVEGFDPEKELSWRSGRLSFVDAPLRDIVADMNQYSDRPVRLGPGAPADMRLTLSFSVQQIGQVLAGLDAAYPIQVRESDTEILISDGL
ncbi:MAG: FecR domain-containing protein [Hyphomonas sp.]